MSKYLIWCRLGTRLLNIAIEGWTKEHPMLASLEQDNIPEGFSVFALQPEHRVHMRTTNGLERINTELKRRTRVAHGFSTQPAVCA